MIYLKLLEKKKNKKKKGKKDGSPPAPKEREIAEGVSGLTEEEKKNSEAAVNEGRSC